MPSRLLCAVGMAGHVFLGLSPPFNSVSAFNIAMATFWFGMLLASIGDRLAKPSGICPNQPRS